MFNESTDIDIASSIGEPSRVEAANEVLLVMAEEELNEAGHKVFEARGVAARAQHTISKIAHTGEIMFRDELYRQVKEKAEELDQRELKLLKLVRMHDETMQRDREDLRKEKQQLVLVMWSLAMAIAVVNLWARLSLDLDPEFGTSPCLYCDL